LADECGGVWCHGGFVAVGVGEPVMVLQCQTTKLDNFCELFETPGIDAEAFRDNIIKLHPQKLATHQYLAPSTQN